MNTPKEFAKALLDGCTLFWTLRPGLKIKFDENGQLVGSSNGGPWEKRHYLFLHSDQFEILEDLNQ